MTGRSMVERGIEHVDTSAARTAWDDRRMAGHMAAAALRANAVSPLDLHEAVAELADELGINWPAVRTAPRPKNALGLHNPPEEGTHA